MPTPVIAPARPAPRDDVIVSELRAKQCELEREVERLQRENEILEMRLERVNMQVRRSAGSLLPPLLIVHVSIF